LSGKKKEILKERLETVLKYFTASQVYIATHAFFLGEDVITFLATERFLQGLPVLKTVPFGIMALGVLQIGTQVLNSEEKTLHAGLIWLGTGVLNFVVNIFVVSSFGLFGAALVTVISYSIGAFVCWIIVYNKYPILVLKSDYFKIVGASLASCSFLFPTTYYLAISPLSMLVIGGLMGTLIYTTFLFFSGFVKRREKNVLKNII
jgi:O-antigen/teichoic acid export membrane protein